jgi:alkylhydroperoxidase family enzyme
MPVADPVAAMEWGECWLEPGAVPPALASEVRRASGGVLPQWAPRLASVPWVVRAMVRGMSKPAAYMPPDLWGPIALVVSRDNSCRYCYGVIRTILHVLGYRDEAIDRIEHDVHLAAISPAEQAAIAFTHKISRADPRPDAADMAALARAGLSPEAIAEIAYAAAFSGFANRIATLFALPSERFFTWLEHPVARLVYPLLARQMRTRPTKPVPPPPNAGPCAVVVAALGDSPAAPLLRETIDEALASPVLPRRTKLLVLAVVGRALGCDAAEREARRGLVDDGLAAADVDEVLAHLGGRMLDARESVIVPFARETVRYQSVAIQKRTRELADRLNREELIETVGVAALANVVGRLSVLLHTC